MKIARGALLTGLLTAIAPAAHAGVVSYDCAVDSIEESGWIPERVLLSLDAEAGKARVYDGYIGHAFEKPIDVKFKDVRGKYRMSWKLPLPSQTSGNVRVSYTAMLTPGSNDFRIKASFPLRNLSNLPRGAGSCKAVKGKSLY